MPINVHDKVRITSQGTTRTGTVTSATNYGHGTQENWYIQLTDINGYPVYWKQAVDGGTVKVIKEGESP